MHSLLKKTGLALLITMPFPAQGSMIELSGKGTVEGDSTWLTTNAVDDNVDFSALTCVDSTSDFPLPGSSLKDLALESPGVFTMTVGGDNGLGQRGIFGYTMNVAIHFASASVSEPSSVALLIGGGLGLWARRRFVKPGTQH